MNYVQLHYYIRKKLVKPRFCEYCSLEKRLDLANKSHKYKKDIRDWLWLCHSCHMKYDLTEKKINKLKKQGFQKNFIPWNKGTPWSSEVKEKIRKNYKPNLYWIGKNRNDAVKEKISIGLKKYWKIKKQK